MFKFIVITSNFGKWLIMNQLMTVKDAQKTMINEISLFGTEECKIEQSLGRILSKNIISKVAHPNFDQSAVDGYAVIFSDFSKEKIQLQKWFLHNNSHNRRYKEISRETLKDFI